MRPTSTGTATGSNAVAQYRAAVRDRYASRSTVPDSVLLWFHRVTWTEQLLTGRTVWDELVHRYSEGVDTVRAMQRAWAALRPAIDSARFAEVADFLDYCRVRSLEAGLRGREPGAFGFTRSDWEEARRAEYFLDRQRRCIRESSYLPLMEPRFAIH